MIYFTLRRGIRGIATQGRLKLDNETEVFTLEPKQKKTGKPRAIPAGSYKLEWHNSPTFGKVIMLQNVVGFDLIYIHAGNTVKDTRGCILTGLGYVASDMTVIDSRKALKLVYDRFKYHDGLKNAVYLNIID